MRATAGAASGTTRRTPAGAATIPDVGNQRSLRDDAPDRGESTLARLVLALLALTVGCSSPPVSPFPRQPLVPPTWLPAVPATHEALSGVLGALAGAGPRSSQDGVRQDMFAGCLATMARFGPVSTPELFPTEPHVLAYLVNAHVAWTIALGEARRLRKLDVSALREVPFSLDRKTTTLAALAGEIARRAPWEPRLALFLNPGWKGGPPLPASALEGHSLDWQLAIHAKLCARTPGFWALDRERKVLKVSAFTDSMWGLPAEQPARVRKLLELVPPPAQLREETQATCGPSLQRCTVTSIGIDEARFFETSPHR